jgi:hypothetical protein
VIGEGRWGHGDLMIGSEGTELDLSLGMSPIVAFGECLLAEAPLSISIHELNADELVEIQFSGAWPIEPDISVTSGWTYSYWKPGMPCPATGSDVREVSLTDAHAIARYTLVISPAKRVVWLYHHHSGFNQLLALTGFADEVFRTHQIRDANFVTQPSRLFERLAEFSDGDLRCAALELNKTSSRRFDASSIVILDRKKKSMFGNLFGKK